MKTCREAEVAAEPAAAASPPPPPPAVLLHAERPMTPRAAQENNSRKRNRELSTKTPTRSTKKRSKN